MKAREYKTTDLQAEHSLVERKVDRLVTEMQNHPERTDEVKEVAAPWVVWLQEVQTELYTRGLLA